MPRFDCQIAELTDAPACGRDARFMVRVVAENGHKPSAFHACYRHRWIIRDVLESSVNALELGREARKSKPA